MEYEMKKCVIIGSAPCEYGCVLEEIDQDNSFIICADGGLDVALENHLTPNLLIADFDSVKNDCRAVWKQFGCKGKKMIPI